MAANSLCPRYYSVEKHRCGCVGGIGVVWQLIRLPIVCLSFMLWEKSSTSFSLTTNTDILDLFCEIFYALFSASLHCCDGTLKCCLSCIHRAFILLETLSLAESLSDYELCYQLLSIKFVLWGGGKPFDNPLRIWQLWPNHRQSLWVMPGSENL